MKKLHVAIASLAVSSIVFGVDFGSEAKRLKPNAEKGAPIVELFLLEEGATEVDKNALPETFVATNVDIVGLKEAKKNNDEEALADLLANVHTEGKPIDAATTKADQDKPDPAFYYGYYGYYGWGWPYTGLIYLSNVYYTWWVPTYTYYYTYSYVSRPGRIRIRW